jgi:DNA-binding SARP family transcriptional activator/TolB-like protein
VIELSLLGMPELRRSGDISDQVLVQPKRLALLAYLAAATGELQRRDRLLLLFWGDQPQARARASLRQALYFLRRSLGEDVFVTRGDEEVGLNPAEVRFDVAEFAQAMADGRPEHALSLYRGDFLADFNISDAPEFERWAGEKRRDLRRDAVGAAWAVADAALASGSSEMTVRMTRRAVDLADYAEGDVRRGMRLAAVAGDRVSALELYASLESRLADDLETVPEGETADLARELRYVAPSVMDTAVRQPLPVGEGTRPTPHTVAPPVTRARTHMRAGGLIALLAAVIIAGLALLRQRQASARDTVSDDRVAVFPFAIRSRAGDAAYLRDGAATLLGLALDGAGRLRSVDANAVLSATPAAADIESGRRAARSLSAGQFVLGEIEAAGGRLSIAATLYDVDGSARMRATAVGDEARVFDLVDSLARRLAIGAMTDSTVRLANAAAASTRSLVAFKAFLAGESQMRAGHYREAVAAFANALQADSTFGLAWYRLSLAREWTDGEISSDSAAALAEHFANHLPDRDRKLLAARRAFVRRDLATGERLANQVLATYPTDADAWAQLGELRFHLGPNVGRSIIESRDPFLNVLRYRPHDLAARVHLTRVAAFTRDSAHVDEWSGRDEVFGDASEIGTFELAAMRAIILGDPRARAALEAATRRATDVTVQSAIWRIGTYAHEFEAASLIAANRRRDGFPSRADALLDDLVRGHLARPAVMDAALRNKHALLVAQMLAEPSAPALPDLARRAREDVARVVDAGVGDDARAAVAATRLLDARYENRLAAFTATRTLSAPDERTVQRIVGAMQLIGQHPAAALILVSTDSLDDASVFGLGLYDMLASVRAEALHALHRDAEAIGWLNATGLGSLSSTSNIPFAVRRRGLIENQQGDAAAATRDVQAFTTFWQSADVELRPLVVETGRLVTQAK